MVGKMSVTISDTAMGAIAAKRFENTTSRTVAAGRPPSPVREPAVAPGPSAERKPRILPLPVATNPSPGIACEHNRSVEY